MQVMNNCKCPLDRWKGDNLNNEQYRVSLEPILENRLVHVQELRLTTKSSPRDGKHNNSLTKTGKDYVTRVS